MIEHAHPTDIRHRCQNMTLHASAFLAWCSEYIITPIVGVRTIDYFLSIQQHGIGMEFLSENPYA